MASYATPLDLYSAYRNLNVLPFDSFMQLGIDVHEYRNNELGGPYSTVAGTAMYHKMVEKIKLYGERFNSTCYSVYFPLMKWSDRKKDPGASISDYIDIDTQWPLYSVFCGKGSPEDIAAALKLAVVFGFAEGNVASLQKFCDVNIGIDCSGFASNYFGFNAKAACGTGASSMAPPDKRLKRLEDVRTGTAIVFKNGKHVAVVDKIIQTDRSPEAGVYALNCMVAESTADRMVEGGPEDGLNYTEYVLLVQYDAKKSLANNDLTLFKIMRPLAGAKNGGYYGVDVRLANW